MDTSQQKTGAPPAPGSARRAFALRFISGKYQGGEFPIYPDKPIVVGRSSDLDMVLVEDMVSRRHAKIAVGSDNTITIEDLGSTNGTFVNGEKVKKARLKEGDRVLIGTSILKVVAADQNAAASQGDAKANLENVAAARRTSQVRTMSGSLQEVPLPDLLQLFGTSKKSGVLVLRTEDDVGKIYLRKGNVYFASINDSDDVPPVKACYRMLTWEQGTFDLDPPDERTFPDEVDLTVAEILMEGMRQLDEFNRLKEQLPPMTAKLGLSSPLIPPLRDLTPDEIDVLQMVHNYGTIAMILNKSMATDLQTTTILLKLIKSQYVETG
jgi:pSer/pThr/pTyr-binding forkhead associated (FHA) protein